ncbi:MAG: chromosome segregation protein SMC [Planctomyces sp.]|nr:chromosome segregation protein SMC [Planctomyces sp.]
MLKALELFGFKSFADRTRFDFASGITSVVGPNGSGKSNVVDALKWILGDQSAKSLRGKEMTDVIFNGAAGRKPSAYAEATLTFDNSSGLLPIETPEVTVGRRIWRNGDAEYLINRQNARLKDVRDLFMGTGAGASAYSIIEQGRVDQILQGNPSSRRAVFEEAAGISRFRSREQEALRKLERVDQNLLRLTDIVDEVEGRLNSTRSQAAKAVKYREIHQELTEWWLGLAADDTRVLQAQLRDCSTKLNELDVLLESTSEEQSRLEAIEKQAEQQLSALDDEIRENGEQLNRLKQEVAGDQATVQFQSARMRELDSELVRLLRQRFVLSRRYEESLVESQSSQSKFVEIQEEHARRLEQWEQRQQHLDQSRSEQEAELAQLQLLQQRVRDIERVGQQLESQSAQLAAQADSQRLTLLMTEQQIEELTEKLAAAQKKVADAQAVLAEAVAAQAGALEHLKSIQSKRHSLLGTQDSARERLGALREQRSAAIARKSVLEDLESREEGLGIGVREILHRARTTRQPPWDSVVGSLSDLLDVDLDDAALVEVALGSRAHVIVLREYQPLLDYLNRGVAQLSSRVQFLAIPESEGTDFRQPAWQGTRLIHFPLDHRQLVSLDGRPGVVTRADRLIRQEKGVHGLAAAVLGDTWIVHDLPAAVRLSAGEGQGCRFVTLQGEVLEANGVVALGTLRSDTAVIPRKSELRQLRLDIARLERDIERQEAAVSQMFSELTVADETLEEAATLADTAAARLADARSHASLAEQARQRLQSDVEKVFAAKTEIQSQIGKFETTQETVRAEQAKLAAQHEACLAEQADVGARLAKKQTEFKSLADELSREQLEIATQTERLAGWEQQRERLLEELQSRQAQRDEAERRVREALAARSELTLQMLNASAVIDECMIEIEAAALEAGRLAFRKRQMRSGRSESMQAELKLRQQRRKLGDDRQNIAMRQRDIEHSLASMAERLQEEGLPAPEELASSTHSALEIYRRQRLSAHEKPAASDEEAAQFTSHDLALEDLTFEAIRPEVDAHVQRLRRKLKMLGSVNTESLNDLEQLEQRYQQLAAQLQDLVEAKATLEDIIRRIKQESRKLFAETFATVRTNFQELFRKVFGGGEGDIILEDPNQILECGIDIKARPPGKELRSISLLSGGERTMTAIALIMAIFRTKPSPFCILDEVDAALDEANVERFTAVIGEFRQNTQFIMITHHKRSMVVADVLYGVTMEESGVSKRMSVRFEDVSDDGNFRPPQATGAA